MVDDRILINIIKEYSTKKNPLTAKDIKEKMDSNVPEAEGQNMHLKTLSRRLKSLVSNKNIEYSCRGDYPNAYWYEATSPLDTYQFRYLIDSVIYSKVLTRKQKDSLLEAIYKMPEVDGEVLRATEYKSEIEIHGKLSNETDVIENIRIIQEAIDCNKKIKFGLIVYTFENGEIATKQYEETLYDDLNNERVVSPHSIVMSGGRYYLLATRRYKNDTLERIYRIDLMKNISICYEHDIKDTPGRLGLSFVTEYLKENPYLYAGETDEVTFLIDAYHFTQFVDWFGNEYSKIEEVNIAVDTTSKKPKKQKKQKEQKKYFKIKINVNTQAFSFWALQYADIVTVLEPKELKEVLIKRMEDTIARYNDPYGTETSQKEQK